MVTSGILFQITFRRQAAYTQNEKEVLASTWACERFSNYLIGSKFHLETDHKPLISLLGSKNPEELPIRLHFHMHLM